MPYKNLKRIMLLIIFISSFLEASMGAILILPRDANVVIGINSGISRTSSSTEIKSTNSAIDGQSYSYNNLVAFIGGMIGIQNDFYRLSLAYDINSDKDIQMQKVLMNFDFKIGEKDSFRPIVGFGVGVAMNSYDINYKTIKQDNGLLVCRTGTEYILDESNSLEFLLEYSYVVTNNTGKSFYEGDDFTTYNIKDKDDISFRIAYNYEF